MTRPRRARAAWHHLPPVRDDADSRAAVAYVRASCEEDDPGGLPAFVQRLLLTQYAADQRFRTVCVFEDIETAGHRGRAAFSAMIAFLTTSSYKVVLAERADRLYRVFTDRIAIADLGVEVHLIGELSPPGTSELSRRQPTPGCMPLTRRFASSRQTA